MIGGRLRHNGIFPANDAAMNDYWLFLGAAVLLDPGETRVLVFGAGDRSTRLSRVEAVLAGRTIDKDVILEAAKLANEYKKKQEDIQLLKEAMQAELAEVVREYQAKMRGKGA